MDLFRISIHITERFKTIYIPELNELVGVIITLLHQTAFIPRNYDVWVCQCLAFKFNWMIFKIDITEVIESRCERVISCHFYRYIHVWDVNVFINRKLIFSACKYSIDTKVFIKKFFSQLLHVRSLYNYLRVKIVYVYKSLNQWRSTFYHDERRSKVLGMFNFTTLSID